jgi:hypothetical protein
MFGDLFLATKAKHSNAFLAAFILFHLTIWTITASVRFWHRCRRKKMDVMLVQDMETYRKECSASYDMETYRRECSAKSNEYHRLRMLQGLHTTETDSSDNSSLSEEIGKRIQETDSQEPNLNQPVPHALGQLSKW